MKPCPEIIYSVDGKSLIWRLYVHSMSYIKDDRFSGCHGWSFRSEKLYSVIFASASETKLPLSSIRGSQDPPWPSLLPTTLPAPCQTWSYTLLSLLPLRSGIRRICKGAAAGNFIHPPSPGANCGLPPVSPSQIRLQQLSQKFAYVFISLGSTAVMLCCLFSSHEPPGLPAMTKSS